MSTPILPFAVWLSGTNQNSLPANDNSMRNQILNGLVISDALTAQPVSPSDGDIYIIPSGATGTQWATFDPDDLTIFQGGTWYAFSPVEGIVVNLGGSLVTWAGSAGYAAVGGGGGGGVTSVNGDTGVVLVPTPFGIACSDLTTDLTTGTTKGYFRAPFAMENFTYRASLVDAASTGTVTVDINKNGATILSTKLTIDATEKTSVTAAVPYVATSTTCADDDEYTVDIDVAGTDAKGLIVWFIGNKT